MKLGIRTGTLYRSFTAGKKGSVTKIVKSDDKGAEIVIGSELPYAEILNRSGVTLVKGKPSTTGRSKTRMEAYFWAKHLEIKDSGNKFWKRNALAVRKKGYIKIKGTQYFDRALSIYKQQYQERLEREIMDDMNDAVQTNIKDLTAITKKVADKFKTFIVKVPAYFNLALAETMTDRGKSYWSNVSGDKTKADWV
jgi:hypothetical protein